MHWNRSRAPLRRLLTWNTSMFTRMASSFNRTATSSTTTRMWRYPSVAKNSMSYCSRA